MVNGVYEPETMKFLRQNADSADTFFDVGANVGYFGLSLKLEFPKLDIVAIEASPAVFPYLEKNRENAGLSVLCVQKVICETTGDEKPFYLPSNDHFGMGSLNADIGQGPPALVESISLDELSRDLNWDARVLIKVDVEGYEYAVFAGGSKLLSRSVSPTIIFEFCDWAEDAAAGIEIGGAQQVLKQFGYQIWRLSDYMAGKPPLEANLKTGTDMLVAAKPGSR